MSERKSQRKKFTYYMRVIDNNTQRVLGYMADISEKGFRIEADEPVEANQRFQVRLDLTGDLGTKSFMVFHAISKWCKVDPTDPTIYQVGFEVVNMSPADLRIFEEMYQRYGARTS